MHRYIWCFFSEVVRRIIGTEHLMLGVVREGEGLAAIVLGTFGITLDWLRAEVARLDPESVEREL